MNGRIVEIGTDGAYVHAERGFLVAAKGTREVGRVALDEIDAVIGNAHGLVWSNEVLARLAASGAPVVLVNRKQWPVGVLLGLAGHHRQGARAAKQAGLSKATKGRLWKTIVQAKLRAQACTLEAFGEPSARLLRLASQVRSGDPGNMEAQGARVYWTQLFGADFRRDADGEGTNALLNFGYTVLRAAVTRAIVATGLSPCLGLKHKSQFNSAALADDLMEPFRPIVDACVRSLRDKGVCELNVYAKRALALWLYREISNDSGSSPIGTCIERLVGSLAQLIEGQDCDLPFPSGMSPDSLRDLGNEGLNGAP